MRRAFDVLVLLLIGSSLSAQTMPVASQPIEDVRKNARVHVGPLYLTPALQLKEFGVDTNVFNQAGEQKADFMFNLSPKADVWVPLARRALITTTVATDLVWYAKYDTERSVDPQCTGRAEVYVRRLTLFAQDAYLNTRQRLNYEV